MNPTQQKVELKINGEQINYSIEENGYVALSRKWEKGDKIEVGLPMEIHRVLAHEKVEANKGKVSLERGPIVYCLEGADNDGRVLNSLLDDDSVITSEYKPEMLNGVVTLAMGAKSIHRDKNNGITQEDKHLIAIPYYAWANRGRGEMAVWIPRTARFSTP